MARSKVAVVRVRPETILDDIDRLHTLAGVEQALKPGTKTILKDNISWHFPFPGANTTPWQLEGTIRALQSRGYTDQVCVQNKTVVTDAFKGEDLNGYVPIFKKYDIPVRYNFKPEEMSWSVYRPKAKMLVLDKIFPEGIQIPDAFHGTNIVQLPTTKCVAADTELVLADGRRVTIADLVEAQLGRAPATVEPDGTRHTGGSVRLLAMTADGQIRPCTATRFAKTTRNGRRVVRVTTRTGRQITATVDHPIYTPTGWAPIETLKVGSRLAIARRLNLVGVPQPLPQTHARQATPRVVASAGRNYTAAYAQSIIDSYASGASVTAIAAQLDVRWQRVQHILKRHEVPLRRNVVGLAIPEKTSPAFWRWMGYFVAEGCTEVIDQGAGKLWWTNTDPVLRADFIQLTRELFGLEARERNAAQISIYSRDLIRFLLELGFPNPAHSGSKLVPELLYRCSDEEIAAFVSAYLDGDGHVPHQGEVSAVTKSPQLARDLVTLYARLGVTAFVAGKRQKLPDRDEWRTYYHVTVSGSELLQLGAHLELRHATKRQRLADHVERIAAGKQPSNWDRVPVDPDTFRALRVGLALSQAEAGPSTSNIECGKVEPTPRIVRQFVERFSSKDTQGAFADEIARLSTLSSRDLAWDYVTQIDEVDEDIALYDITVPEASSFVGSGVVVHNCHIYTTTTGAMKNAFGGLLNTKRHYTHSWIHETLVDLLAIQKEIHAGLFAVMDGTTAGDGPGPRTMRPVIKDVMLASEDQVAIDAVAAQMMGFDPMSLAYIRLADEAKLGNGKRENIEVVGDTDAADERWGFSVGDNGASMIGDVMWFGPLKRFQKLFFHTPLVNLFVLGSEAYHDYYRWPLRDRKVFENWKRTTHWGRLFEDYQKRGTLQLPAPREAAK